MTVLRWFRSLFPDYRAGYRDGLVTGLQNARVLYLVAAGRARAYEGEYFDVANTAWVGECGLLPQPAPGVDRRRAAEQAAAASHDLIRAQLDRR